MLDDAIEFLRLCGQSAYRLTIRSCHHPSQEIDWRSGFTRKYTVSLFVMPIRFELLILLSSVALVRFILEFVHKGFEMFDRGHESHNMFRVCPIYAVQLC